MSNILIVTDQPLYSTSNSHRIAGPTISVSTVFSGDIADAKFDVLRKVRGVKYDSILLPKTIFPDSPVMKKVLDFVDELIKVSPEVKTHIYDNQY